MSRYTLEDIQLTPILLSNLSEAEQTEALCRAILPVSPFSIRHIHRQTPALCRLAIEADPNALRYIHEQTHDLCMAAVQQAPQTIRLVMEQTPEMCLMAVTLDPMTLAYVRIDHAPQLCLEAVTRSALALEYVRLPHQELAQPASQQLAHWVSVLHACSRADRASVEGTLYPLVDAVPLGKQYLDEWRQRLSDGELFIDQLRQLVAELKRLAPEDAKVADLHQRVHQQADRIVKATQGTSRASEPVKRWKEFGL